MSWLLYCSDTKSNCAGTTGQPRQVTNIQMAAPGKIESQNKRFGIHFFRIQTLSLEKIMFCGLKLHCILLF